MKIFLLSLSLIASFGFAKASSPFQFVSPMPGAKLVNVEHNIVLRPGATLDVTTVRSTSFTVEASKSGKHNFSIKISADGKTINLDPVSPFAFDETVTVTVENGILTFDHKPVSSYSFSFSTHREFSDEERNSFKQAPQDLQQRELKRWNAEETSVADTRDVQGQFDIPINDNPTKGDIFFDSFSGWGYPNKFTGYTIINNNGDSLFQRKLGFADDFKLQHNGLFAVYNGDYGRFDVLDSNFNQVDKYYGVNGYSTDNHEIQILADGHALLIAQEFQIVDMTVYNPDYSPNATVFGGVIQEFDENHVLVFEWRAFDHIAITEALHEDLSYSYIDYTHTNALEIDNDGNILASNRHLDQINKIDRNTGEFIWRLGGVNNQFTFTNDAEQFTYQHDIRRIANGDITLFDNGNWHAVAHTTAKEYQLDEVNKTATLVWSYSHKDDNGNNLFYFAMGDVQRLSNGNTFINWGWRGNTSYPSMSEVTSDGTIVWELHLTSAKNMVAYRSHKYDYEACARPTFQKMRSVNVTSSSATLKWTPAWGAVKYAIQLSQQNSGVWLQKVIDGSKTSRTITNLLPNTTYEWKMQTWCDENGSTASGFTQVKKFQTQPMKSLIAEEAPIEISLYPNPAAQYVSIESNPAKISEVRILNLLGQEFLHQTFNGETSDAPILLSLNGIPSGNYIITLLAGGKTEVRKLTIE